MRTTLAIETSTPTARVALARGDDLLYEQSQLSGRSHNALIFGLLKDALATAKPDAIAIGTGPGSYTGIRIGISAATGISLIHQTPVIGLPSLSAMVDQDGAAMANYIAIGDARRGEIWVAHIENFQLVDGPEVLSPEAARARLSNADLPLATPDPAPPLPDIEAKPITPSAQALARQVSLLDDNTLAALANTPPTPIYLAAPFVTQPKKAGKL